MQEVFEKIIEKLEENQTIVFNLGGGKPKQSIDLERAIEIVKQEAEQCKSIYMDGEYCWQSCWCTDRCGECNRLCNGDIDYYESYDARNNGWIPCSVHLPEENGYYYVTQIVKSISTGKKIAIEKSYVEFSEGEWRMAKHLEVIAWLDIEPYHPKGE